MLLEIDEVAIDPTLTTEQLREKLDGITLELHAFGGQEQAHWNVRTIRELAEEGILTSVVIFTGRDATHDPLPTVEGLALKEIYRRIDAVLETPLPRDVTVVLRQILPKGYKHSFHQ